MFEPPQPPPTEFCDSCGGEVLEDAEGRPQCCECMRFARASDRADADEAAADRIRDRGVCDIDHDRVSLRDAGRGHLIR